MHNYRLCIVVGPVCLCKDKCTDVAMNVTFKTYTTVMQSINGVSLKEHWAAQHSLQEAIVAQRSSVYRTELYTVR